MIAQYKGFNGKWGYVNINGEKITEPIYTNCEKFQDGLARVNENKFINSRGEELKTQFIIQEARDYVEEYVAVLVKGKWGMMNKTGELVIPAIYNTITDFNDGFAGAYNKNGFFVLDKEGKEKKINYAFEGQKSKVKLFGVKQFHESMAIVMIDLVHGPNDELMYGFINENAVVIIEPSYLGFGIFNDGLAWVETMKKKFGFVDKKGNVVIEPKDLKVGDFQSGLAWFRSEDKKIGFINNKGEEVVKSKYMKVGKFFGGIAWVRNMDGAIGYINNKGKEIVAPKFKNGGNFDPISGLARIVDENNKKGYVNNKGEVTYFENTNIFKHFVEGLSVEKKGKLVGFIDNTGEWAIEPKYKVATNFKNGFSKVKMFVNRKNRWGIINKKGEWVVEPLYMKIYEFYSAE